MLFNPELFSLQEWVFLGLIFVWSGFVRAALGFGGAAMALPFMLLLRPDPLLWLPIVATHLLFFTAITLSRRKANVDWPYLWQTLKVMIIPKIAGVVGLVILPLPLLVIIIYVIILVYALSNIFNWVLKSKHPVVTRMFLALGGYVSGTSLMGAPLIVAVYSQYVEKLRLRDTLFALWFILVTIKMLALVALQIPLQWQLSLILLPIVGIGHMVGMRAHIKLVTGDDLFFRRVLGVALLVVSVVGLTR